MDYNYFYYEAIKEIIKKDERVPLTIDPILISP